MHRDQTPDLKETEATRARYQRIALLYDRMESLAEKRYSPWRKRLWSQVDGHSILEVGVGTGKNMPYYPPDAEITAIDLTPGMLERARKRAGALGLSIDLRLGDVQALEFPDSSFDSVVATFVFCSVPDPLPGLREVMRVIRPGGKFLLLEHVRPRQPLLGTLMDLLNPLVVRMMGPNINRRTVDNVVLAGFNLESVEDLGSGDIFKLIVAHPPTIKEEK